MINSGTFQHTRNQLLFYAAKANNFVIIALDGNSPIINCLRDQTLKEDQKSPTYNLHISFAILEADFLDIPTSLEKKAEIVRTLWNKGSLEDHS